MTKQTTSEKPDTVMLATADEDCCLCDVEAMQTEGQILADMMQCEISARNPVTDERVASWRPQRARAESMGAFREMLKAGAVAEYRRGFGRCFRPALRLNGRAVWIGKDKCRGPDARALAIDEAERVLACSDGSMMAEELQAVCDGTRATVEA